MKHYTDKDDIPNIVDIGVKQINPDATIPNYSKIGDSGFDLVAMVDMIIHPGETATIPTGLAFEIPLGLEIQVRPRSGITAKTKLRVILGTVDSNYRGEVKVNVDNIAQIRWMHDLDTKGLVPIKTHTVCTLTGEYENTPVAVPMGSIIIKKGQRIAQGVIASVYRGNFGKKEELSETNRGTDGFGSSGV